MRFCTGTPGRADMTALESAFRDDAIASLRRMYIALDAAIEPPSTSVCSRALLSTPRQFSVQTSSLSPRHGRPRPRPGEDRHYQSTALHHHVPTSLPSSRPVIHLVRGASGLFISATYHDHHHAHDAPSAMTAYNAGQRTASLAGCESSELAREYFAPERPPYAYDGVLTTVQALAQISGHWTTEAGHVMQRCYNWQRVVRKTC
ncbi:hypothetical protein MRB53_038080 [Persea americana]|nr:hypothetical protein MRB53_038080 [Persea americana]